MMSTRVGDNYYNTNQQGLFSEKYRGVEMPPEETTIITDY
jgi:hypothetical protein